MFQRIGAFAVLVIAIAACAGTPTAGTPIPGATDTPGAGATETPGETPGGQTNPPAGDLEATARALVPPGSTETSKSEAGGFFQLILTSTTSIGDLEAFWDQKIPSLGLTLAVKSTAQGVLTYAFTNPDGAISAVSDEAGGGVVIGIQVGTGS